MMAYFSLLLIVILTMTIVQGLFLFTVLMHSSSHNTDLSQVISLQYCIIYNCAIMKIDTGEQLNIVYTTESLLIVTPTDGLTSMMITKIDDELSRLKTIMTANYLKT